MTETIAGESLSGRVPGWARPGGPPVWEAQAPKIGCQNSHAREPVPNRSADPDPIPDLEPPARGR